MNKAQVNRALNDMVDKGLLCYNVHSKTFVDVRSLVFVCPHCKKKVLPAFTKRQLEGEKEKL
jgi:hypothetical protein